MKIAYLILCHNHPAQLARLVAALPSTSPVFIHVDARTPRALFEAMKKAVQFHPQLRFVERHRCFWSGFGILEGTNALIKAALSSSINFDRATLLSGADYPIASHGAINARLADAGDSEFIEAFPLHEANRWSGHQGLFHGPSRVDWYHLRFRSRAWRLPFRRQLPLGYTPWGGSQWWTLTRPALVHIDHVNRAHPELLRFFRNVFLPDESYIQTVLANSPFREKIADDDLRFIIWDRPEPPYPAVLKSGDLDLLLASNKHFARKFDLEHHPSIYDHIDMALGDTPGRD